MTLVQVNGLRFQTATVWTVDRVQLSFSQTQGGPSAFQAYVSDPGGPNAGIDLNATVVSWTNTQIVIDVNELNVDEYVTQALAQDSTLTQFILFDLVPDQPTTDPVVTAMDSPLDNQVRITGTNLLASDQMDILWAPNGVNDNITIFNPAGPNNGLNLGGAVIVWGDTEITVTYAPLDGETVNYANVYGYADAFLYTFDCVDFVVI